MKMQPTQPAFMKALEATNNIVAREATGKLSMLPEVEVTMAPLNGRDDLRIKTAKTSLLNFNKMINEFLFTKGKYNGIEFKDLEDWESKITSIDKEILTALLLDSSYTRLPKRVTVCEKCGNEITYDLTISEIWSNPETKIPVWEENDPVYEKIFEEEFFNGAMKVKIKYPTEKDRNEVYSIMSIDNIRKNIIEKGETLDSTDALMIFIDTIEIIVPKEDGKNEVITLTNKFQDIKGYLDLAPLEVHNEIKEFINKTFEKYSLDLRYKVTCEHCHTDNNIPFAPDAELYIAAFS